MGIKSSRTGKGSSAARECSRMRPAAGDAVGRSEVREGGVGEGDRERELGLSGEEVRGEDIGSRGFLGDVEEEEVGEDDWRDNSYGVMIA
jgi:hypothetical protein